MFLMFQYPCTFISAAFSQRHFCRLLHYNRSILMRQSLMSNSLISKRSEGMPIFRGLMPMSDWYKREGRLVASAKKLRVPECRESVSEYLFEG